MSESSPQTPAWLQAAPAIFLLLWSLGFPVAKICLAYIEPMTFLALRYALVLLILLPLLFVLRPAFPEKPPDWFHVAVVGFLIQVVYFGLCYLAFALGEQAGTVALIVSLQPILVALLAPKLAGERVGVWRWVGLLFGLAGAALVITARSATGMTSWVGLVLVAGALIGMTAGALYEKRYGRSYHPVASNLVQYSVGLVGTMPFALLLETNRIEWTTEFVWSLAYLVVANSIISLSLLLAMIRYGEVSRVSALFFLVPPITALLSWLLLGESIQPLAWPGIALAALGVALANSPFRQAKPQLSSSSQR